jgi:hypothetical protein
MGMTMAMGMRMGRELVVEPYAAGLRELLAFHHS